MNSAPNVLSNAGKDIKHRLGFQVRDEKTVGSISNLKPWEYIYQPGVEIRRRGMSKLFLGKDLN